LLSPFLDGKPNPDQPTGIKRDFDSFVTGSYDAFTTAEMGSQTDGPVIVDF